MKALSSNRDWKALLSYLPANYEQLAHEHGLLKTQWLNAKVTSADVLLQFILLHAGAGLPLRQTVAAVAQSGGPTLTQVWLHKRMKRATPYLAALVAGMVSDADSANSPERWCGYEMMCLDATTVSCPGSKGTDARIHAVLSLHDLHIHDVEVTGPSEGETLRRFAWLPDQLVIVDRGYSTPPGIAHVVDQGAAVLVRVNRGSLPLYPPDQPGALGRIDILEWCRTIQGYQPTERRAVSHVQERNKLQRSIEGRLIAVRLPSKEANEARERVKREYGRDTTQEQLEAAEYVVLFTTAPAARMSTALCVNAYRLRWQIELQFKRWKSLCHFDRLPNHLHETIQSWLTAKVLLGLLLDRIGSTESTSAASSTRPLARQAWKLTSLAWPLIVSALLPLRLADAQHHLPAIAARLAELDATEPPLQVEAFRNGAIARRHRLKC